MAEFCNVEVWVVVDDGGFYAVGTSRDDVVEHYEEKVQPVADAAGIRCLRLAVSVPLPRLVEVAVDIPALEAVPAVAVQAA
jgi:hypothetical protein